MSKLPGAIVAAMVAALAFVPFAHARVHTIQSAQHLSLPDEQPLEGFPALAVAIDGDSLIAVVDRAAGRQALLYRRVGGQWVYSRLLVQSTAPASHRRASVAMKNWLAAIDIAGVTTIWEKSGGNWARARTDGDIRLPGGHAISGKSILIGASGCTEDGRIYQKATDGVWRMTGRLPPLSGMCVNQERDVELNYDYALINGYSGNVTAWARNGANVDWRPAGNFELQGASALRGGSLALQNTLCVAPGSTAYRRIGTASWAAASGPVPMDFAMGGGDAQRVWYRDSVLLTVENDGQTFAKPYAYVLDAAGKFDHVAILESPGNVVDLDISGTTVVSANVDNGDWHTVTVFDLPSPLVPPDGIPNDFNARDLTGIAASSGSGFAIAGNQYDYIYRQSKLAGATRAVLTNSNWARYQSVSAQVRPTAFGGPDAGAGFALRYVDDDNHLAVYLTGTNTARVESRRDGATTVLSEAGLPPASGWRSVYAEIDGEFINIVVDETEVLWTWDASAAPAQGRVAMVTRNARADFDNLYASPTRVRQILFKRYDGGDDPTPPLRTTGGAWLDPQPWQTTYGLQQYDLNSLAFALTAGPSVGNQSVIVTAQLDAWGGTSPVSWFGPVARYVDASNYYYLSVRASNQVQIRKVVNGVTTVLDAAAFTAPVGAMQSYELRVEGNQLHGFVNNQRRVTAIDSDLAAGRYGVATYRTAATFRYVWATDR